MKSSYSLEDYDKLLYGYVITEIFSLCFKYKIFAGLVCNPGVSSHLLAEKLSLEPEALTRMLLTLKATNIVTGDEQGFEMNPVFLPYFDTNNLRYLGSFTQFVCDQGRKSIHKLESILTREIIPESPYDEIYNRDKSYSFAAAMWELSQCTGRPLVPFLPERLGRLVDVGGGSGAMASMIIAAEKATSVTVFDLPDVEVEFRKHSDNVAEFHHIKFESGNFFKDPLPFGDNYLLSNVLSNWDDSSVAAILGKIRERLSAAGIGQVYILERLFGAKVSEYSTAVMHLNMMLHTQGGHRDIDEYKALLTQAGFSKVELIETGNDRQIIVGSL